MSKHLTKRGGEAVPLDEAKLLGTIERGLKGLPYVDAQEVLAQVKKNIYAGMSTKDIHHLVVMAASSLIEVAPEYSKAAARFSLMALRKEVIGVSVADAALDGAYRESFKTNIFKGVEEGILNPRMESFDLERLSQALVLERDDLLEYMGMTILYGRYFLRIDDRRVELPQSYWMRIAMGLAIQEDDKEKWAIEFYNVLSQLRALSSTPTLLHSGMKRAQLSSCFLNTVDDDLKHIFKVFGDNAEMAKWSGGIGTDWTNVRATNSLIKSTRVESQGPIPFMKVANDATFAINRSGERRGAAAIYQEVWHLDFEDFIDLKKSTGDERRRTHDLHTAAWIPDLFMERVVSDGDWYLFCPADVLDLHEIYGRRFKERYNHYESLAKSGVLRHKKLKAKYLWRRMVTSLYENGGPWATWKDAANVRSPQDHVGVIHNSNLCTEVEINNSFDETAVCNLLSANIAAHTDEYGNLDLVELARTVRTGTRMLDNVIDINFYPTKECEKSNMRHRPVGMGTMGWADLFYKKAVSFESDEAKILTDEVMEWISYHAILGSVELAKEKGPYSTFKGSKWDRGILPLDTLDLLEQERGEPIPVNRDSRLDWNNVKENIAKYGMRNSLTIAVAPNATISNIAGCFACIEPIYKNIHVKNNKNGDFPVINQYMVKDLRKLGLWNKDLLDKIKGNEGSIQKIREIPKRIRDLYKEAFEVDPRKCIELTAIRGKWIDQAQSHNVFIASTSGKAISDLYIMAWKYGLKSTYYLKTLAATSNEKATLDTTAITQNRTVESNLEPKPCRLNDPTCESCQ